MKPTVKYIGMKAINITAYTEDASQIEAIKAVIKAFKIKFKISKVVETETPYNIEFVTKVLQGGKDFEAGKGRKVTRVELNNLWK